jgi:hypothetical protein
MIFCLPFLHSIPLSAILIAAAPTAAPDITNFQCLSSSPRDELTVIILMAALAVAATVPLESSSSCSTLLQSPYEAHPDGAKRPLKVPSLDMYRSGTITVRATPTPAPSWTRAIGWVVGPGPISVSFTTLLLIPDSVAVAVVCSTICLILTSWTPRHSETGSETAEE